MPLLTSLTLLIAVPPYLPYLPDSRLSPAPRIPPRTALFLSSRYPPSPLGAAPPRWVELLGISNTLELLEDMKTARVIVVPGAYFYHDGVETDFSRPSSFVRVSFATAADEAIEEGFRRLGGILRARGKGATKVQ